MRRKKKADIAPGMLTTAKAAAELGIAPKTLLKYIKAGRLAASQYTEDGPYYIAPEALEKFRAQCRVVRP